MTRTIIYARVSTEDQLEKYGLPAQLRACREFAANNGLSIVEEITDDGVSGVVLERPGLGRIRQMVADGLVDVVLMLDADRLSRQMAHLLILKPEVERKARLEFVTAKFEDSPSGRLFFGIRGVVAEYERELTRERTMRGRRERARAGLIVGGRIPYGYQYDSGRLTPDAGRAETIRQIFDWYSSGVSIRSIATRLRQSGAPTYAGKKWGHSSVRRILVNETYAGIAHYGTHRREGARLKLRDPKERIAVVVPALVPRPQWERVQARLAENPQVGRPTSTYLLRGLLQCPCGRRMGGDRRREQLSYRCSGRDRMRVHGEACRKTVDARKVDRAVWDALMNAFLQPDALRNIVAEHQRDLQLAGPEKLEQLQQQVRKLRSREERCMALLVDADLADGRESLKRAYLEAQRTRQAAERELSALTAAGRQIASSEQWLEATVELLREYLPTLVTPEARQEFVRGLLARAEWDGATELRLVCFFGSKSGTSSARCDDFAPPQIIVKARLAA